MAGESATRGPQPRVVVVPGEAKLTPEAARVYVDLETSTDPATREAVAQIRAEGRTEVELIARHFRSIQVAIPTGLSEDAETEFRAVVVRAAERWASNRRRAA